MNAKLCSSAAQRFPFSRNLTSNSIFPGKSTLKDLSLHVYLFLVAIKRFALLGEINAEKSERVAARPLCRAAP